MIVRAERGDDVAGIHALVAAAFDDEPTAKLVDDFRASPGYLPELSLVAEADGGTLLGHVMFTLTKLEDGTPILMLSPLAVLAAHRRHGIGAALVREGLRRCAERDEDVVIVEGDPRYYSRFGFVRASELGLERPYERIPEQAFQAMPARPGAMVPAGRVVYPPPLAPFYTL